MGQVLVGHLQCAYCVLSLGALTLRLLSFQLCDVVRDHIFLLQGSACGAGLQTWASRAPFAAFLPPLVILRNMPSIASFPYPGGGRATQGKGELEPHPKGKQVVIREVENRTELKGSGFDCACLFSDCKQGPG